MPPKLAPSLAHNVPPVVLLSCAPRGLCRVRPQAEHRAALDVASAPKTKWEPRTTAHEAWQLPSRCRAGRGGARASSPASWCCHAPGNRSPGVCSELWWVWVCACAVWKRWPRARSRGRGGLLSPFRRVAMPCSSHPGRSLAPGRRHVVGEWLVEARTPSRMVGPVTCSGHTRLCRLNCPLIKSGHAVSVICKFRGSPSSKQYRAPTRTC